jgi:hypothetical protein
MHEMDGFAHEDIELCIAHQTGNAVSRSYNRATTVERDGSLCRRGPIT